MWQKDEDGKWRLQKNNNAAEAHGAVGLLSHLVIGGGSSLQKKKFTVDPDRQDADRHLICPITLQYPSHPAVAGNGKIWERSALEEYIQRNCPGGETSVKCPVTGLDMPATITPSPTIKNIIQDFIKEKGTVNADRHLICPITLQYPSHPVVAGNGKIWEWSALEEYIERKRRQRPRLLSVKCPVTGLDMPATITPSPTIKNMIEDFIKSGSIEGELAETWTKVNDQIDRANNGDVVAMYNISVHYSNGSDGFPQDHKESFLWAKKAHDAGYIPGTNEIGVKMINGIGTTKNSMRGMMYIAMAAPGLDIAAFNLGQANAYGWCGLGVDNAEAIKWLEVSLSGECEFEFMTEEMVQYAQELLDQLLSS